MLCCSSDVAPMFIRSCTVPNFFCTFADVIKCSLMTIRKNMRWALVPNAAFMRNAAAATPGNLQPAASDAPASTSSKKKKEK